MALREKGALHGDFGRLVANPIDQFAVKHLGVIVFYGSLQFARRFSSNTPRSDSYVGRNGNASALQFLNNRIPHKPSALAVTELGQMGVDQLKEFFLHHDRYEFLPFGTLVGHGCI